MIRKSKICIIGLLLSLFFFYSCTDEQPVVLTEITVGSVVGIIKPVEIVARISLIQGVVIDSAVSDSASGYFAIEDVRTGFYTLEVIAPGYGKYVLEKVEIVANGVTSVGDILLRPIPDQIVTFSPASGTKDVGLNQPCSFEFNVLMDHASVENGFSISPFVEGEFQWLDNNEGSIFFFYPSQQYRANTLYEFSLDTKAMSLYGDSLLFTLSTVFTTESVKIVSFTPENGATYVNPRTSIYTRFNTVMDRESVENAFSIVPETRGQFKWHDEISFTFIPNSYLATRSSYIVTISRGAKDNYESHVESSFISTFITEPLMVIDSFPKDASTELSRNTPIMIAFNSEVEQRKAEQAFSITPALDGVFAWSDKTKFSYRPSVQMAANAYYFVALDSTCVDEYGENLKEAFTIIFQTGSF